MEIDSSQPNEQTVDVDEVIAGIPQTQTEIPMEQAKAPDKPSEYEFKWNGKVIKAPIEKLTQYASQGYDYAQKMHEFNQRQKEIEQRQNDILKLQDYYKKIDDYAKENPEWWNHVTQQWDNRSKENFDKINQTDATIDNPVLNEKFTAMEKKLQELAEFKNGYDKELENKKVQAEDAKLSEEIESIRKTFPNLDLNEADEAGKTLEFRVLEYANQRGIRSFEDAFYAYKRDALAKLYEERGMQKVQGTIKNNSRLGIIAEKPTTKEITDVQNHQRKTYGDITNEALDELRSMGVIN